MEEPSAHLHLNISSTCCYKSIWKTFYFIVLNYLTLFDIGSLPFKVRRMCSKETDRNNFRVEMSPSLSCCSHWGVFVLLYPWNSSKWFVLTISVSYMTLEIGSCWHSSTLNFQLLLSNSFPQRGFIIFDLSLLEMFPLRPFEPFEKLPRPISSKNKHFNGRDFDGRRCPKGSHRVTPLPAGAICWLDSKTLARYKSFTQQNMSVCSPRLMILKFPYKGSVFWSVFF